MICTQPHCQSCTCPAPGREVCWSTDSKRGLCGRAVGYYQGNGWVNGNPRLLTCEDCIALLPICSARRCDGAEGHEGPHWYWDPERGVVKESEK